MPWGVKQTVILVGVGVSMSVWAALLYVLLRTKDDENAEILPTDVSKCKVQTSRQTIIRMKIPNSVVGSVIGRNGCNIKEIQQKTNTRINFEDSDDEDLRNVIIRGSPADAQEAENIINKVVIEQPEVFTEEIYVPSRSCGRIIGKNGESIKYISRTSKARVSVDSNSDDRRAESLTRIVLRGSRQQIDMAIGLIDEKLAEDEALRRQVELISANRPTRYKGKLCIENPSEQGTESDKFQESLTATANDGFLEVYVSAVESPSQFCVQLVGTKSIQLDKMVEEMTSFYSQNKNQELTKLSSISVGDLIAAPFPHDNLWYRAKVTNIEEEDYSAGESKMGVFYVDFGDTGILLHKQAFSLQPEFLVVPFQAIECSLGNVAPLDKQWTEEAITYFEQLTYTAQWKPIMAKPINYIAKDTDKKATVACVTLIDTNSATDINVAEELIKKNYAVKVFDERLK